MKRAASSAQPASKRGTGVGVLYRELKQLERSNEFTVEAHEDNFCAWTVHIPALLLSTTLQTDVAKWAQMQRQPPALVLELELSVDWPIDVPSVRVIRPRFQYRTGHVTIGGSFCTEMLTESGWRPMTVEALLRSILATLDDGNARVQLTPDRHCPRPDLDYTRDEARLAYTRTLMQHGWK